MAHGVAPQTVSLEIRYSGSILYSAPTYSTVVDCFSLLLVKGMHL